MPFELPSVETVGLLAYAAFLAWRAFRPAMGFASWHMFAMVDKCRFELHHADGRPFNPWDHLPHFYISMARSTCGDFMAYLREIRGIDDLEGIIHTLRNEERGTIEIRGSHVVD